MQLRASGSPFLEPRLEQVDHALRVAQLGPAHPLEFLVADELAGAVGVGRHDDAFDRAIVGVVAGGRGCERRRSRLAARPSSAVLAGLLGRGGGVGRRRHQGRQLGQRHRLTPGTPEPLEDPAVDLQVLVAADEDRGTGSLDFVAIADVDEGEGARKVDRRAEIG